MVQDVTRVHSIYRIYPFRASVPTTTLPLASSYSQKVSFKPQDLRQIALSASIFMPFIEPLLYIEYPDTMNALHVKTQGS